MIREDIAFGLGALTLWAWLYRGKALEFLLMWKKERKTSEAPLFLPSVSPAEELLHQLQSESEEKKTFISPGTGFSKIDPDQADSLYHAIHAGEPHLTEMDEEAAYWNL